MIFVIGVEQRRGLIADPKNDYNLNLPRYIDSTGVLVLAGIH
jgi:hypothetical protein